MLNLKPRLSRDGKLTAIPGGWRFWIPEGPAYRYRLSQLDDHLGLARPTYPWHPPMRMQLEARVSAQALPGTWGFGLWNDPYGFSFGPGNGFLRLPALPDAAWFFFSSPSNYLSFRDDTPGNGFLAQLFASHSAGLLLWRAFASLPFWRRTARRLLSQIILEATVRIDAEPASGALAPTGLDVTEWHKYEIEWTAGGTKFRVDDDLVLASPLSPRSPLGIVIWIDNQFATFTPQGKLTWGTRDES